MLSTEAMEERHTAVNISQRLREISTDWKVAEKVEAIVHDNAANMVLAATLLDEGLDWSHVVCVGHTLQLSINDGLKEATISKMVSIARKMVGHFNHSALACSKLHAVEEQQGRKKLLNLVQDVPTRWNSTLLMLDRLVLLSNAVMAVLDGEKDTSRLKLSGTQWDLAKEVVGVLKPLQMATTVLSMDTNPSLSCAYPVVHALVNQHLVMRNGDSIPVQKLKERMASDLEERFHLQPAEDADVHVAWLASALDPRFKQLSFLSEQNTSAVWSHLRSRVERLFGMAAHADDSNSTEEEEEEQQQEEEGESAGGISAMSFLVGASSSGSPETPESDEVTRYKAEPAVLDSEDPLKWWKKNEERFLVLAQVCKSILSIPATRTPSERLFSTC